MAVTFLTDADKVILDEQIASLEASIDTLNAGGLELKEDFIGTQVDGWLDAHPEAITNKDYVTPQMYGWVDGNDVGVVINQIFADGKNVFLPNGVYPVNTTIVLTGSYHSDTCGQSIVGDVGTVLYPTQNIPIIRVTGSNSTIERLRLNLERYSSYSSAAIIFTSSAEAVPCFANTMRDVVIWNVNSTAPNGVGVKFDVNGDGFAYLNNIDNLQLYNLENGMLFTGNTTMGINANNFVNLKIWRCSIGILCNHGISGSIITGNGQSGEMRDKYSANDGYAFITLRGEYNKVSMMVYDTGVNGNTKYAYSILGTSYKNIIEHATSSNTIKNNYYNFYTSRNTTLPIVAAREEKNQDYALYGYPEFRMSDQFIISDYNNILNTEFVKDVSFTVTSGSAARFGAYSIDFTKVDELRKLSKISNDSIGLIVRGSENDVAYTCELTYTFDNDNDKNPGNLRYVAIQSSNIFTGFASAQCEVEVIANYHNGSSVVLTPLNTPVNSQIAMTRMFEVKDKIVITSGGVDSLTIRFTGIGSDTNASTIGISKVIATFVRNPYAQGNFSTYHSGVADRSGCLFFGDVEFTSGNGVVLLSPNGDRYKLTVDDSGVLSASKQ